MRTSLNCFRRGTAWMLVALLLTLGEVSWAATLSISGQPATTATVGVSYSFIPTVTSSDSRAPRFKISNKPAWMYFDGKTGRLWGTPQSANIGTYGNIVISASTNKATASLAPFSITVSAPVTVTPNTPPTISGAPTLTTFVGRAYSFTPSASDANGDPLTFGIANKPAWATFNTSTGTLAGTPTAAATHADIVISVSDGKATTSLNAFTLVVNAVVTGSATLSWTAPTHDVNGNVLTTLAGYRVIYGTDPNQLTKTLELPSPSLTSVEIGGLTSGTYYFAVKAYTATGLESDRSEVVWKSIL